MQIGSQFLVNIQPVGKRIEVPAEVSLLESARLAGVELVSLCGGLGICDSCKVRLIKGKLTKHTLEEHAIFSPAELAAGYRLACQAYPLSDVTIDVPVESLTAPQRLQIEGQGVVVTPDSLLKSIDLELQPPTLQDLRADTTRLSDAMRLNSEFIYSDQPYSFAHSVLENISDRLRLEDWSVRVVYRGGEIIVLLPIASQMLGLAADIGTTKLAIYLVDLETGQTLASTGEMNPQISYGEDVLSRISYANQHVRGRYTLHDRLMSTLNKLTADLCAQIGANYEQIVDAVLVGNTAMHHLAANLPVRQLGEAPYVPAVSEEMNVPSSQIGLMIAPGANTHFPPNIAGFVGADHVAMLLASETIYRAESGQVNYPVIALDIGTNTEISLIFTDRKSGRVRVLSCSAASGPAFEGAHIHDGMRAAPGAIERVQIDTGGIRLHTIGNRPPVGICGSGILDAVAQMLDNGILNHRGALRTGHPQVRQGSRGRGELLLAPATSTGHGNEIVVTREDVHEIQLAKAAIRAGIEVLLAEAGISAVDLATANGVSFIVAGAFGTYIHLPSAIRIGMFPTLPLERFAQIGNAAGIGARQMLLSEKRRQYAGQIANQIEYIELANHAGFNRLFMQALFFQ